MAAGVAFNIFDQLNVTGKISIEEALDLVKPGFANAKLAEKA